MGKEIFVSNRLPYTVNSDKTIEKGSGGLVSALMSVNLDNPFSWFGFETNLQHCKIIRCEADKMRSNLTCHPVSISKELYEGYYDGFANNALWPLLHYEGHLVHFDSTKWRSYVEANELMATALIENIEPDDTVWIHDFHFFYLPKLLRDKFPKLKIGFFLHTPFPVYEVFRQLPNHQQLLSALLNCDLIGFHESSYLFHFMSSAKSALGLSTNLFKVHYEGRDVHLGVFPISINTQEFKVKCQSVAFNSRCENLKTKIQDKFLILGVDRLDYMKGLDLKLLGFQKALRKYPALVGKASIIQIAVPTRQKVPSYMRLKKDIDRLVGEINGEFAQPGYTPVQYIYKSIPENDLLALYHEADVNLITSKRDGMNLVAMEYAAAQSLDSAGVLILSEFAGAATLLTESLTINPWDSDSVADAIFKAYSMKKSEKTRRMKRLKSVLARYSSSKWASNFLYELQSLPTAKAPTSAVVLNGGPLTENLYQDLVQAKELRVILDYDGTLVPITENPAKALLQPERKRLLEQLAKVAEICIVSGRPREFLQQQFTDGPYLLVAEHGAFYKYPGQSWQTRISSNIQSWYPEALKIMQNFSEHVPFSFVEQKESALVWHFRASPAFAEYKANRLEEELQVGLINHPALITRGKKIVEAKATESNKGDFVRWLLQQDEDKKTSICFGDDQTDEDMFAALKGQGTTVKIGEEATQADFRILTSEDLYTLLTNITKRRKGAFLKPSLELISKASARGLIKKSRGLSANKAFITATPSSVRKEGP